jgi:hypothetical protein
MEEVPTSWKKMGLFIHFNHLISFQVTFNSYIVVVLVSAGEIQKINSIQTKAPLTGLSIEVTQRYKAKVLTSLLLS